MIPQQSQDMKAERVVQGIASSSPPLVVVVVVVTTPEFEFGCDVHGDVDGECLVLLPVERLVLLLCCVLVIRTYPGKRAVRGQNRKKKSRNPPHSLRVILLQCG